MSEILPNTSQHQNSQEIVGPAKGRPGRRSLNEGIQRRLKVRRLLRLKLRIDEIASKLKVSRRTVLNDFSIIRKEDRGYLEQIRKEGFVSEFLTSLSYLQDLQRQLLLIQNDPMTKPEARIKAIEVNGVLEARALDLLAGFGASLLRFADINKAVPDSIQSRLNLPPEKEAGLDLENFSRWKVSDEKSDT